MDQERQPKAVVNYEPNRKALPEEEEWEKQVEMTHRGFQRLDDPNNEVIGEFKTPATKTTRTTQGVDIEEEKSNISVYNNAPNTQEVQAPLEATVLDTVANEARRHDNNNNGYDDADEVATVKAEIRVSEEDPMENPESLLPQWEHPVADMIMSLSGEMEWPSVLGDDVKNSREAMDLVAAVGHFTTACLFSQRFILREKAIDVILDKMTQFYSATPAAIEQAVLRYFDMNSYGLQDTIPSVVAAACVFIRMVLADDYNCLISVLAPVVNLLPRLLCCAADAHPRIRDESRRTLVMYVNTDKVPNANILLAVLADPIDKERLLWRSGSSTTISPRVQIARLMLLEELITCDGSATREHDKALWTKFLIPCLNHQNQEVRNLAVSITTYLMRERRTTLTVKRAAKIYNVTIRDHLQSVAAAIAARKV
ncbi:hypothetical protein LSM04_006264 [Trypanosoma melophagium]|uniref:uncharacterized protein n=1 Tax=Trypanosoma melophagium TaxID=715481 RepID=UPI003519FDB2|nr:hypothetical protein LSM04_006264 [Trypanosoma melophagium]